MSHAYSRVLQDMATVAGMLMSMHTGNIRIAAHRSLDPTEAAYMTLHFQLMNLKFCFVLFYCSCNGNMEAVYCHLHNCCLFHAVHDELPCDFMLIIFAFLNVQYIVSEVI